MGYPIVYSTTNSCTDAPCVQHDSSILVSFDFISFSELASRGRLNAASAGNMSGTSPQIRAVPVASIPEKLGEQASSGVQNLEILRALQV